MRGEPMILAGDIGATKVHLALYRTPLGKLTRYRDARFATSAFESLEAIVRRFLGPDQVSAACFGLPGPRTGQPWFMANLPWIIHREDVAIQLNCRHVYLLNDVEASGHAVAGLSEAQLCRLNDGTHRADGNRVVVSVGTGLGLSYAVWNGRAHIPQPSDGGHADFAPRNEDECDLLRFLMRTYGGRVSVERVVSGMGISNIYAFLRDERGMKPPKWLLEDIATTDLNSAVTRAGLDERCDLCTKVIDIFLSAFGAAAGNAGLSMLSTGGLYIGGGIAPRLISRMQDGTFMQAFTDKGRLSWVLESMPVHVILDTMAPLDGAAAYALARSKGAIAEHP